LTLCCLPCQNCQALISSSGLFSSRNINITTLWKRKLLQSYLEADKIFGLSSLYLLQTVASNLHSMGYWKH
jgi:hypothetical protein